MEAFARELLRRSPLASAVLEICDHIFDDQLIQDIWQKHRGRCYDDVLQFNDLLRLLRDALIHHGGSANKLFVHLHDSGSKPPVDDSNFYRKLARTPVEVSRALLRQCTQRIAPLMIEPAAKLPTCFDAFEVAACDGKTIKNAAKRLAPTRGYVGRLLGAKALVALDLRKGIAVAMSDSLDGMSNEVPLVPALVAQLFEVLGDKPLLSVWDRQFDDLDTLGHLSQRPGDAFVVRMKHKNMTFVAESAVEGRDSQGRRTLDEVGVLSSDKKKKSMRLRRITLFRDAKQGEDDVVLLSNLLDREQYASADVLELYRQRWCIEQVFQQVTETFALSHLIGCKPQAVLLQFAYCLLLYNVMQVVKAYVANDGRVLASVVSMHYLFDDVRTELVAWAYHTDGHWPRQRRTASELVQRLRELLAGSWRAIKYTKRSDKKPRGKPAAKLWLHGGHTSVQRALEGRARAVKRKMVVRR